MSFVLRPGEPRGLRLARTLCWVLLAPTLTAVEATDFGFALAHRSELGSGPIRQIVFAPGGQSLAVAIGERILWIELAPDGAPARTTELRGTRGEVRGVACNASGTGVAAVDASGTLAFWHPSTGELGWSRRAHRGEGRAVAFTTDGRYLLTGGKEGDVRAWTTDGQPFADLTRGGAKKQGEVRALLPHGPGRGAFTVHEAGQLSLWNVDTQREVRPTPVDMKVTSAATDPGGRVVALGLQQLDARTWDSIDVLRLIDAETGTELHEVPGGDQDLDAVAVAPDARFVAVGGSAKQATVWDVATGRRVTEIPLDDPATALAFGTTGRWLAVGTSRGGLSLFELTGVGAAPALPGPSGVAPGGPIVIVIVEPKTVILHRTAAPARVTTRSLRVEGRISSTTPIERLEIDGREITAIQPIEEGEYRFTAFVSLPEPGRREVEIVARDQAGTVGRESFVIERATDVPPPDPTQGRRIALIVGVSRYADDSIDLEFADDDARALRDLLMSPALGPAAFEPENVRLLLDEQATVSAINTGLREFLQRSRENDFVLFFFAGHGAPDPNRLHDLYLLAHDTDPKNIAGTGLLMRHVREAIASIQARDVLILTDACHSAGMGAPASMRSLAANPIHEVFLEKMRHSSGGLAILTASEAAQYSLEREGRGHGVFTWHLLAGLRGAADADGDRVVTLGEAMEHVRENVKNETNGVQIPAIGPTSFDRELPLVPVPESGDG